MASVDKEYWKIELPHPYAPSDDDVSFLKSKLLDGTILLLGNTHKLIPIAHRIIDIDPWFIDDRVLRADWRSNDVYYDNIIGDGVLNFSRDLADGVVSMASKYSKRLIVRSFASKLERMVVADYFPRCDDFGIMPSDVVCFKDYYFYVWDF